MINTRGALLAIGDETIKPLNDMTAVEVLTDEGQFMNFVRALELSGVGDLLEKKGPHTVFAPSDDIFNEYTMGGTIGSAKLDELMRRFVVPGKYVLEDLYRLQVLKTVDGYPLFITNRDGVEINGARIVKPDVPYDRGVIHEIGGPDEG
jgi:uncharacterized surface protein with fasciclin (FAS1) repeats